MASHDLSLANLVGRDVLIKVPAWKGNELIQVKLIGVEVGGIWVENANLMEVLLEGTPHKMTEGSMRMFLPYAQILAIYDFGGGPWISEKVAQ